MKVLDVVYPLTQCKGFWRRCRGSGYLAADRQPKVAGATACSGGCTQALPWLKWCGWLKGTTPNSWLFLPTVIRCHQNHGGVAASGPRQQNVTGLSSYHPRASGSGRYSGRNLKCLCLSWFFLGWVSNLISSCLLGFSHQMFNRYPALSVCKTNCRGLCFLPHIILLTFELNAWPFFVLGYPFILQILWFLP